MLIKIIVKNIKKKGLTDNKQAYITNVFKLCRFTVNFFKGFFLGALLIFLLNIIFSGDFAYASMLFFVTMISGAIAMLTIGAVVHLILYIRYKKSENKEERVE